MSVEFNTLVQSFDSAIKNKEDGKFGKDDVKAIYKAAALLFDGESYIDPKQLKKIGEKWVTLAEGRINMSNAMKKLQGTSRAEAIQSVLLSIAKS